MQRTEKNAIIMAAGISSRFVPISFERPKALLTVRGEILIERQIRQLLEAEVTDITIVVGYKKEMFEYLKVKFGVRIIENPEYTTRNNHSSIYYARDFLANTFICSADNYFAENVFESAVDKSYYASVFHNGPTDEWCITANDEGLIKKVQVGGSDSWVMLGHAFLSDEFSNRFVEILEETYHDPSISSFFWEDLYLRYINELDLYVRKYPEGVIYEFDSLAELRSFDYTYWRETGSEILKSICRKLKCSQNQVVDIVPLKKGNEATGFSFSVDGISYLYDHRDHSLTKRG